ncbi:MAG: outer membrane lipoprotein-sorting protein [Nitrospiria bacterium]
MIQKVILITILTSSLFLTAPKSIAEEAPAKPSPSPEAILRASHKRMYAMDDQTATVIFRVVSAKGVEKKTLFKLFWKNGFGRDNLNSKTLLVTESPSQKKGQKFLVWEYVEEDKADLWLYLPDLRQVRRVQPGRHRHDDEEESDLLFEDMHQRRVEVDDHLLLPEKKVRGEPCFVIENRLRENRLYGKTVTYISKNQGTIRKIEYFSREGTLLKTQWIEWRQIGRTFVWKESQIFKAQSRRKTFIEVDDVKVNVDLPDSLFSERALRQ